MVYIKTKSQFIKALRDQYIDISHFSARQLDYRYHQYKLYEILIKYNNDEFEILGVPESLEISLFPSGKSYNINKGSKYVTLCYELYKLHERGYWNEEELVTESIKILNRYKENTVTIKQLTQELRNTRISFIEEQKHLFGI